METIFLIKDLICGYKKKSKDVLKIDELLIERGKITAIIGSSGVGKSTLLEALSLMNNTIRSGTIEYYDHSDKSVSISELWKEPKAELIKYRKEHFSFIFQTPFLLEDYQVEENLLVPKYLHSFRMNGDWINEMKKFLDCLFVLDKLPEYPNELSFGQRQRIAFIYALISKYNVLFCDEPTGSLNRYNAEILLDLLRCIIKKSNKTAIIVSHDIPLMEEYADVGVFLKDPGDGIAQLSEIKEFKNYNLSYNEIQFKIDCESL